MKLKELLEDKDMKMKLLAKKLNVAVSEIERDGNEFTIGDKDYLVYTKREATKEAIDNVVDTMHETGLEAFSKSFKKEILNIKYAKPNKKREVKELLAYYDEEPDYVEETLQKGYMDLEKIAALVVKKDGLGNILSSYDGKSINLGSGLTAYRNN